MNAVFESGTLLGKGGEGEVRRVEVDGIPYAVKKLQCSFREEQWSDTVRTPFVQTSLAPVHTRTADYCIFPLAAGDLEQALLAGTTARAQAAQLPSMTHLMGPLLMVEQESASASASAAAPVACCAPQQAPPEDRLSPAEFLPVAAESCVAVAALHDAAIVHKDVKPANFLVAADGHLCMGDLGVSDDASHHALSGAGTWFFHAPEQRCKLTRLGKMLHALRVAIANIAERLGFPCDSRPVDVWALAVTWLVLSLPVDEVLRVVKAAHAGKPLQLPTYVPTALADLLQRGMLVKRPSKRFTIRQVMAHPFFAGVSWPQAEARRLSLPDLRALAAMGREYMQAVQ